MDQSKESWESDLDIKIGEVVRRDLCQERLSATIILRFN